MRSSAPATGSGSASRRTTPVTCISLIAARAAFGKSLFPSAEIEGGDNRVERGRRYEIPSGYTFTFDEQPGAEKLFIVLSRRPEPDLERLIYSLGQRRPAEDTRPEPAPKVLLAQSTIRIDDALIGPIPEPTLATSSSRR